MKKISLKNILKKTFKKTPLKKKNKASIKSGKKKRPIKKTKSLKTSKKIKKNLKASKPSPIKKKNSEKVEIKTDNFRISKSNELKPKVKDYVVYPKHGVGQITEFKKINIGGIDVETYILKFEKDKANGMVPINKQSHLRPLATINQIKKCNSILKSKPKIKRSMWSRRAQEYESKISSGKIYELAEVVRDLNKGDDLMVDERILSEFQIVMGVSLVDTKKKLDKTLKRNLEGQQKTTDSPSKLTTPEISETESISETDE